MRYEIEEILEREEQDRLRAERRRNTVNRKRFTKHSLYPTLIVDARTTKEVEETRKSDMIPPGIFRLARKANSKGTPFKVKRDKDGAFRIKDRLDGNKAC